MFHTHQSETHWYDVKSVITQKLHKLGDSAMFNNQRDRGVTHREKDKDSHNSVKN